MFDYFCWYASVLWIGSFAIYWIATQKSRIFSTAFSVLILSLFLGVAGYTNFGKFHEGNIYHYAEIWHYYLGSKYYKEVSQKYLYVSVVGAFEELKAKRQVPYVSEVRNLEQPFEVYSMADAERIFKEKARSQFTSRRWAQFKTDVEGFLDCPQSAWRWEPLNDAGYNPPPSYNAVVGTIASLIPITPGTMSMIPFIDWSLIAIALMVLFRTFGFLAVAVFLLIFCTNNIAGFGWIGGSFCRYFWFVALTLAICALERKRYFLAGIGYGFAIALRIFPFVFLFGACLPFVAGLFKDWRKNIEPIIAMLTGALLVVTTLVLISLLKYPLSHWSDFFAKICLHNKLFFIMHMSFDKLAAGTINLAPQYFGDKDFFENWNIVLNDRFNEHWMLYRSVALLFVAGSVFACSRTQPIMSSLLAGETILFFYAMPAHYYYIYLATFGVVTVLALKETPLKGNSLRYWSLMIFLIFINMVRAISGDWIILNWMINLALFCLLIIYILSQLFQNRFNWNEDKYRLLITAVFVAFMAFMTFKPRELPVTNPSGLKTQILMFTPKDVESGAGWIQNMRSYDPHWPIQEHLLANNPDGLVSVVKHFVIPRKGEYLVTIYHASAVDYVDAKVTFSSVDSQQVNMPTWSPTAIMGQDNFFCEFPAGENSIHISGMGSPSRRFLGINSIKLKPL